jgi:hypothetical protein
LFLNLSIHCEIIKIFRFFENNFERAQKIEIIDLSITNLDDYLRILVKVKAVYEAVIEEGNQKLIMNEPDLMEQFQRILHIKILSKNSYIQ